MWCKFGDMNVVFGNEVKLSPNYEEMLKTKPSVLSLISPCKTLASSFSHDNFHGKQMLDKYICIFDQNVLNQEIAK